MPSYFGIWFGPSSSSGGTIVVPPSSDEVAKALFDAWTPLGLNTSAGPFHLNQAPRGAEPPYVVLQVTSEDPAYNTSTRYLERVFLRFQVVSTSESDAMTRGRALEAALRFRVLSLTSSTAKAMRPTGAALLRDPAPWSDGRPRVRRVLTYIVPVIRTRA